MKRQITFDKWVMKFIGQNHMYSDFAKDIKADEAFPKGGSFDTIMNHLSAISAPNEVFKVFIEAWKKYRLEHGNKRMFFDVYVDLDKGPIFSDFVNEKDMYKFIITMESKGHRVDVLADTEHYDSKSTYFMVEVENVFDENWYMYLDDMIKLPRIDNVVQFPIK